MVIGITMMPMFPIGPTHAICSTYQHNYFCVRVAKGACRKGVGSWLIHAVLLASFGAV